MSFRFRRRSVVLPTQTEVHGQVGAKFPVILREYAVNGRPVILSASHRCGTRYWIHLDLFEDRCSVGEVPQTLENLNGTGSADQTAVVLLVTVLETKL